MEQNNERRSHEGDRQQTKRTSPPLRRQKVRRMSGGGKVKQLPGAVYRHATSRYRGDRVHRWAVGEEKVQGQAGAETAEARSAPRARIQGGIQMDSVEEEEEERSGGRKIRAAALCCGGPSDRHTRTVPTMGTGLYRGRR